MKVLKQYWSWLQSHPIFALVTSLLFVVFLAAPVLSWLKTTKLPGTDKLPTVVPPTPTAAS